MLRSKTLLEAVAILIATIILAMSMSGHFKITKRNSPTPHHAVVVEASAP